MAFIKSIATVLKDDLYRSRTMWDILDFRVAELQEQGDQLSLLQADSLISYKLTATSPLMLEMFNGMMQSVYHSLYGNFQTRFSIYSRLKSVVRRMEKTETLAVENRNLLFKSNPFEILTDDLALRIVVNDNVETMYNIANYIVDFFKEEYQVEPCLAQPLRDVGFKKSEDSPYTKVKCGENNDFYYYRCIPKDINIDSPDFDIRQFPIVSIPKKSGLKPKYRKFFKDYVVNPKDNLYQSLHMVYQLPNTNFHFEIQIRTSMMDAYAEHSFNANHGALRQLQNQKIEHDNIDFNQLNIDGVVVTFNPEAPYKDNHFLFDSLILGQNTKTIISVSSK
jgi:hypothetical protein